MTTLSLPYTQRYFFLQGLRVWINLFCITDSTWSHCGLRWIPCNSHSNLFIWRSTQTDLSWIWTLYHETDKAPGKAYSEVELDLKHSTKGTHFQHANSCSTMTQQLLTQPSRVGFIFSHTLQCLVATCGWSRIRHNAGRPFISGIPLGNENGGYPMNKTPHPASMIGSQSSRNQTACYLHHISLTLLYCNFW